MVKNGEQMSADQVLEVLAIDLIGIVPDDKEITISNNIGVPLVGNTSLAGQAFMNICHRIMGEEVPFIDFNKKQGFFSKLFGKK